VGSVCSSTFLPRRFGFPDSPECGDEKAAVWSVQGGRNGQYTTPIVAVFCDNSFLDFVFPICEFSSPPLILSLSIQYTCLFFNV